MMVWSSGERQLLHQLHASQVVATPSINNDANRTLFHHSLCDEDIPDKAKDPGGGEAKDPGGEVEPQEDKARKKFQASGRGTTALAAVLPRGGTIAPTTASTTASNRRSTEVVTVVAAVLP